MWMRLTVVGCLMVLTVLNSAPPADAFGYDILEQLSELLFGSDESDESTETVINAKPNATVTVVCKKECNLNVTCINCNKIDTAMMKPTNGNGGSKPPTNGGNGASGSGGSNGATMAPTSTTPLPATTVGDAEPAPTIPPADGP